MPTGQLAHARVARVELSQDLAADWDRLSASPFQRRDFLSYLERYNPCSQRYYELRDAQGTLRAGAVLYTLPIDLLTFRGLPSKMKLQFVGVPCSVPAPGLVGELDWQSRLVQRLRLEEPQLLVGLNIDQDLDDTDAGKQGLVWGRTLPTAVLTRRFSNWNQYILGLRSDYRRRLLQQQAACSALQVRQGSCADFSQQDYDLYLQVYARSDAKLEKLSMGFFKNLPSAYVMRRLVRNEQCVAWNICLRDDDEFYFFLEGHRADIEGVYFCQLLDVLRQGIAAGVARIDLGQTAEVPKTRLGATLIERKMFATHPSALLRGLITKASDLLIYKRQVPTPRVFRT